MREERGDEQWEVEWMMLCSEAFRESVGSVEKQRDGQQRIYDDMRITNTKLLLQRACVWLELD